MSSESRPGHELSRYELFRLANIARNKAFMENLGIPDLIVRSHKEHFFFFFLFFFF